MRARSHTRATASWSSCGLIPRADYYSGGYGGTRGTIGNECTIGTRSVILLCGRPAQDQKWVFV